MIHTEKTLTEVLEVLKGRGYTEDFNLLVVKDMHDKDGGKVKIEDLIIDRVYRFASQNDVSDEAVLYAIRNRKDGSKGVFVNGYGIYTDEEATAILDQIPINTEDTEDWLG
mgnify:FL=1